MGARRGDEFLFAPLGARSPHLPTYRLPGRFLSRYLAQSRPVLLKGDLEHWLESHWVKVLRKAWSRGSLLAAHGGATTRAREMQSVLALSPALLTARWRL